MRRIGLLTFMIFASFIEEKWGFLDFESIISAVKIAERGLTYFHLTEDERNNLNLWDFLSDDKSDIMINRMDDIADKLDDLDAYLRQELSSIHLVVENLGAQNLIDEQKSDLIQAFTLIEDYYKRYLYYKSLKYVADSILRVFADEVFLHVLPVMSQIHGIMAPGGNFGGIEAGLAYRIAKNYVNVQFRDCGKGQSPQYFLAHFLHLVCVAEVQALTILVPSYVVKFNSTKDAVIDVDRLHGEFRAKLEHYRRHFRASLSIISRVYRNCEPRSGFQLDVTYYQLREVYRPAIGTCTSQNSGPLVIDHLPEVHGFAESLDSWEICTECPPEVQLPNARAQCFGAFSDCRGLGWVQACVNEDGVPRFSSVKFGPSAILTTSTLYGSPDKCRGTFIYPKNYFVVADTNYCLCKCFPHHRDLEKTDREAVYVLSTQTMSADVTKSQIITGIGFTRVGFAIGIKIKIGILHKHGDVVTPDDPWIEPTNFDDLIIRESKKNTGRRSGLPDAIPKGSPLVAVNENTYFHLGRFVAEPNAVITSVAFAVVPNELGQLITLNITSHKLNHASGKFYSASTVAPERKPSSKKTLHTSRRNVINTKMSHKPDSDSYDQVKLEVSSLKDDIGQTMVPWMDGVTIESNPPTALGGLQLYHKSATDSVGFLSWALVSLNYGENFEELFDKLLRGETLKNKGRL